MEIRQEQDVVLARQRAREISGALGFEGQIQTRIATAVSEIVRNAFRYAGGGRVEFFLSTELHPTDARRARQTFIIEVKDGGSGISNLDEILEGRYRSQSGLGIGLIGAKRLMDRVDIDTSPRGTKITLCKLLPPGIALRTPSQLQGIVDELSKRPQAAPLEEIQLQNRELVQAIDEAGKRQEELSRVNQELAETNTGVMALYDELETLNRISVMLASKLELRPLIQSIIDVTTSLTDADVGLFFLNDGDHWTVYARAGANAGALADIPPAVLAEVFSEEPLLSAMEHVADLHAHDQPTVCGRCAKKFGDGLVARSCMMVPVWETQGGLTGVFFFVSAKPGHFTERSERILSSVSTQAAVGIEKARLFQTVTAASDAKDHFFATLSHELRTPLNPALAIISSLQDDPRITGDLRDDIDIVARNIRLEARLIDDLLDFNRLIKGKLQLVTEVVDIHGLIESVVEICSTDLEAKGQELRIELQAPQTLVMGEAARLQQVLWNVLKNAIKFTPDGGIIEIRTEVAEGHARVTISDNGQGIDPTMLDRIFRAFDQGGRRPNSPSVGLGLGLSIAKMFVELHRGRIRAHSEGQGKGATLVIEIPLTNETVAKPSVQRPAASTTPLQGARVLLVEDHGDTRKGLARLLTHRGFMVTATENGVEAIAAANAQPFDLLISDLGLPDCSGLELVSKIAALQKIPAIALSGYGMESDLANSKNAGFDVHITKPVEFKLLLQAIETLLPRK